MTTYSDDGPDPARSLAGVVDSLSRNVADLQVVAKTLRLRLILLAVSVAFDILLSVGLGAVAWETASVSHQATVASQKAAASTTAICLSANVVRGDERKLWAYVFSLEPAGGGGTAAEARAKSFLKFVDTTFAPRNCSALGK